MTPDQAPEAKENTHTWKDVDAGYKFRETLVTRADADNHGAPLWHGWAIMDAFLAGIDHAKASLDSLPRASVDATDRVIANVVRANTHIPKDDKFWDGVTAVAKALHATLSPSQDTRPGAG